MRIPLDYYRILGLPILATADQIQQAFRDRTIQLPRQEFSTQAVASRKTLLQQAYDLLVDDEKRRDYDARFLATTYDPEIPGESSDAATNLSSDIEVEESQFVGAIVLLQELGEYESVLRFGRPYLSPTNTAIQEARLGEPEAALSDIVLAIALACLELGREEWQQGQYDNAAEALETGHELLIREGLFPTVRAEIQADLYKLRPYRILAMLSDPDEDAPIRERGLEMLRDMLNDRQGIDGHGIDQSGLGVDDFLRFIQQLRDYMTVDEQQALFEAESRRPSAVATYLSVYALMAKGFARQEPALIRRAKAMLARLGSRQDVYLEQSICSLLLGQPDVAAKALERSQEYEPLAFIRDHSQDASDLLPGLCLYTERWMQEEVFPHFRDLTQQTASLKDYFANPQVQSYLEELPQETESPSPLNSVQPGARSNAVSPVRSRDVRRSTDAVAPRHNPKEGSGHGFESSVGSASRLSPESSSAHDTLTTHSAGLVASADDDGANWSASDPALAGAAATASSNARRNGRRRSMQPLESTVDLAAGGTASDQSRARVRPRAGTSPAWLKPLLGLFLLGLLGFGLVQLLTPRATIVDRNLEPTVATPTPVAPTPAVSPQPGIRGAMTEATAKQAIQAWFDAKKLAFGPTHDIAKLSEILTEPRLSKWRSEAIAAKEENLTIAYTHEVEIKAVEVNPTNPDQAIVTAYVSEARTYTKDGNPLESDTDELTLNYQLVRENQQWKIQDW